MLNKYVYLHAAMVVMTTHTPSHHLTTLHATSLHASWATHTTSLHALGSTHASTLHASWTIHAAHTTLPILRLIAKTCQSTIT